MDLFSFSEKNASWDIRHASDKNDTLWSHDFSDFFIWLNPKNVWMKWVIQKYIINVTTKNIHIFSK